MAFPYMVSAWGGMTFLIPYVLFVILIGSTGVIEEMALGRATKGGPIKAFGDCMQMRTGKRKAGEAIGFIPVLGSLALAMGYTVVVGWIFKYTYLAFLESFHQWAMICQLLVVCLEVQQAHLAIICGL